MRERQPDSVEFDFERHELAEVFDKLCNPPDGYVFGEIRPQGNLVSVRYWRIVEEPDDG